MIPITTVTFIPTTQYKFVAKFDFSNVPGTFVFNFTIKLNPAFSSYFTQQDIQQVIVVTIDMAVLSRVEPTDTLVTGNLQSNNNTRPTVNNTNQNKTPTIDGIPQQAIDLLFLKWRVKKLHFIWLPTFLFVHLLKIFVLKLIGWLIWFWIRLNFLFYRYYITIYLLKIYRWKWDK